MIEGTEITPGLWVLQNRETRGNTGVVLHESGAALIDLGSEQVELDAAERFLEENGGARVEALLFTTEPQGMGFEERWPGAVRITPRTLLEAPLLPVSVQGWEVLMLSGGAGRVGVYHAGERILFCGDMLRGQGIPSLAAGAETLLEALEKVERLDVKLAVPSRGTAAQGKREVRERVEQDRGYAMSVVRHVVTSRAAAIPLERMLHVATEMYQDFPYLQEHLRNIGDVWAEMGG
jgi:glyoxylase-like metal-dependent hydrolase (beta-lactamase superfamily II)